MDDALREDEALNALRRYGKPVGAAVIAGLMALAGYIWWGAHKEDAAAARAETYTLALDQLDGGNLAGASAGLAPLAASGGDGSQAAARLLQAGIAEKQGDSAKAASIYAAVMADSSTPAPLHDLANVRDVALRFDALPADQVVARLRPLAAPGNAWFGSAGELVGMAYLKQGHRDLAAPLFGAIAKDKTVPETLRNRARQMAGLLGYDSVDDAANEAGAGDAPASH